MSPTNRTPRKLSKRWNYPSLDDDDDRPYSIEDWRRHRDQIMQYEAVFGRRPPEWWLYEHNMECPDHHEEAILYEMGDELRHDELDYLMAFWREHFDKALSDSCPISFGPDNQPLTGLAAQRAWLEWAGIPKSLLVRWHAERKRKLEQLLK